MPEPERPRLGHLATLLLALLAVATAFWLPTWWERREYRKAEAIAGVGSPILAGSVSEARKRIGPGSTAEVARAALGQPSFAAGVQGSSRHEIWTYYYADGTMRINLTDGVIARIGIDYGPPKIPTSRRRD